MREEIERVIAELELKQAQSYDRMREAIDIERKKFINGYIDGINISLHKLKEVLSNEPLKHGERRGDKT